MHATSDYHVGARGVRRVITHEIHRCARQILPFSHPLQRRCVLKDIAEVRLLGKLAGCHICADISIARWTHVSNGKLIFVGLTRSAYPGDIVLTRILCGASSTARGCKSPLTAPFEAL